MKKRTRSILTASSLVLFVVAAVIYARPLELYSALSLAPDMLERELQLAGYRRENPVSGAGGYNRIGDEFHLISRGFAFPSGVEEAMKCIIRFHGNRIASLSREGTGHPLPFLRLAPARIGSIHPLVHEGEAVRGTRY